MNNHLDMPICTTIGQVRVENADNTDTEKLSVVWGNKMQLNTRMTKFRYVKGEILCFRCMKCYL